MRVVLLNQPFYPDVVATAQMGKDLADELIARGHEVHAIASRSIYGHRGATLPKSETIDGILIHRVGASLFGRRGLAARAMDFLLFYVLATLRLLTLPRPDVIVAFTTPPMIALAAHLTRRIRGSRVVYWVMDLYPDVPVAVGMWSAGAPHVRLFEWINRRLLRRSDAVVVLGRCMRTRVLDKGVDPALVRLIPVWPVDAAGIEPVEPGANRVRAEWGIANDTVVVMYSGNLGLAHEAGTICRAMERLKDDPRIRFEFIGGGNRRAEVEAFIHKRGLANARYHDYQPVDRLSESLGAGDVHLISVRQGLEGLIVPSKLYGIMAAARPILYIGSPESEVALMVRESGCGALIGEGDDEELARQIRRLADDPNTRRAMGVRGREALVGKYDPASSCRAWAELLESLLPASAKGAT